MYPRNGHVIPGYTASESPTNSSPNTDGLFSRFFSTASITSYESVYGSGSADWEAVEAGLLSEMFEGRTTDEVFRG